MERSPPINHCRYVFVEFPFSSVPSYTVQMLFDFQLLGSRGNAIAHFSEQIKNGWPITVTHQNIMRYFKTIQEVLRLVIQAGTLVKGGEIVVLDMGEPVKIVDLSINVIRLSGYTEDEIKIEFNGLRPLELIDQIGNYFRMNSHCPTDAKPRRRGFHLH